MGGAIRAPTNTPRPYHKKKRAVHQAASDFGIISHSPLVTSFTAPRACFLNKHKHDEHVTRFITLLQNCPHGIVESPSMARTALAGFSMQRSHNIFRQLLTAPAFQNIVANPHLAHQCFQFLHTDHFFQNTPIYAVMRHGSTFYFQQSRSMLCPFCHPARIVFSTNLCHYHDCQYGFQSIPQSFGLALVT